MQSIRKILFPRARGPTEPFEPPEIAISPINFRFIVAPFFERRNVVRKVKISLCQFPSTAVEFQGSAHLLMYIDEGR
jgi:hypothetical protein